MRLFLQSITISPLLSREAPCPGVVGPAVHALLHVALVGVAFVGKLLLRTRELRRVHPRIVPGHPRAHRITPGVHWVVVIGHGIPQPLWIHG